MAADLAESAFIAMQGPPPALSFDAWPTALFTLMGTTPGPVPDPGIAPVVTNLIPAEGTPIYSTTPLQFDVTDDSGLLAAITVMVSFPDGSYDTVWDNSVFAANYSASTSAPIAGGLRFVLRRVGGWTGSPRVKVVVVDQAGKPNV
jgi:hypothetical protein